MFFTIRIVKHRNRLPREVIDAPSLNRFSVRLDLEQPDLSIDILAEELDWMTFKCPFLFKWFYDSVNSCLLLPLLVPLTDSVQGIWPIEGHKLKLSILKDNPAGKYTWAQLLGALLPPREHHLETTPCFFEILIAIKMRTWYTVFDIFTCTHPCPHPACMTTIPQGTSNE